MKPILTEDTVLVPERVAFSVDRKKVSVSGPMGRNERDFGGSRVEFEVDEKGRVLHVRSWFGDRASRAQVRTVAAHVRNMANGVLAGYEIKLQSIYNIYRPFLVLKDSTLRIGGFMGNRYNPVLKVPKGVQIIFTDEGKTPSRPSDVYLLRGTDLEKVTAFAGQICGIRPHNKDPVRFSDGIYRMSLQYIDKEILERDSS